ncbi:protein ripply3, partial [Octodon degus]|uniref:Protein ripply3 n=1 Tax=Octodon degus TaxID=10160 RepID=A0A6P6EQ64_OCTDE
RCRSKGSRVPGTHLSDPLPCRPVPSPTLWRPWTLSTGGSQHEPGRDQEILRSKGAFGFQHPVRLYLPVSKREKYLQGSGEEVLASFPVQATIHFYNDESESESESDKEEQEEEARPREPQCQQQKAMETVAQRDAVKSGFGPPEMR